MEHVLFVFYFSIILQNAFADLEIRISFNFPTTGGLFNP